ncbi:hypothetical protein CAOG_09128 [Capsaspora owczarzaki ATCC 30864]|uniref:TKL/IRAK protein kinase n=1 Tax=Capsaspora owczarzaki (strain ATCC 30864) TaxID=595528 RepID=A0A0D2WXZ0_CAPO3|nr:hypothetical protein CAOG_09128 [Capsaspora owczarzaki ATCC 30864]KJE97708.1 TKL/IRAK protein kinase [Capsaspora owczarzaki ATCC 30864]|eukprot:XP_011270838.1 hypothetical protein CAOG_09128 [Capsaspora owczarzaki ATCC 30864]
MLAYQNMNQRQRQFYDQVKNASGQLNLERRQIGDEEAKAIAEALKVNKTLTYLDLHNNQIGDVGALAFAEALKVNKALAEIRLWANQIGEVGAQAIAKALKANTTLGTLYLGENQLGDAGAQAIAEALQVNTTLPKLYLRENQIGDVGAQAIAEALKVNKTLTTLSLYQNQIGDVGAQAIAEALKVNKTLTELSLWQNQIGDVGAQAIAEALKVNTTLKQLYLWQNQIGDVGANAIAEALKVNKTLTRLDLYKNQIGDVGAQAIAESLKANTTLGTLSLGDNQIGDAGAQAIAEALNVNTTLTELYLGENQIGDVGAQAIAEALKVNKTLTTLLLHSNFLTNAGTTALRQTGSTICQFESAFARLDQQRTPSPADLAQIAARAAANAQSPPSATPASEIQQLRSELAAKDQELQQLRSELTAKNARIDVLERNQAASESLSNFDGPIPQVPLATLISATNNFAADSLLGEGAFGRVYGASLPGPRVAIKKLSAESIQHYAAFQSELKSLSKFRHPNIIVMLSYAEEGDERCLVYEFMPNGSVRDRLARKNNTPPLTWSQRHRIGADVARGMHYVQTAFPDHALFHLDLKTDNVLLDAHFNAKVSDFGLVRAAQHLDDKSYLRTQTVQGTIAYMCPEFLEEGRMTIKTDVYAFGMILLELLTAAKPGARLKKDARNAVKNQNAIGMLDSALTPTEAERESVGNLVALALECLDEEANDRPSFGSILVQLDP